MPGCPPTWPARRRRVCQAPLPHLNTVAEHLSEAPWARTYALIKDYLTAERTTLGRRRRVLFEKCASTKRKDKDDEALAKQYGRALAIFNVGWTPSATAHLRPGLYPTV